MFNIEARKVLTMSYDELVAIPHQLVRLSFDDGELVTGWRGTIFCWYMWEFHRQYPDTPLLLRHHMGNKRLTRDTSIEVMSECFWSTFESAPAAAKTRVFVEELCKLTYQVTNTIFNDTDRIEEWITTLMAEDFVEILTHPGIRDLNENVMPNEMSISAAYSGIKAVLKDEHELQRNWLAKAVKSNLVKIGQALQCVGPRGFLTDLDSHRFNIPVLQSYAAGIYDAYGVGVESRSGAKSLIFNKELIKDTEYFNREMQLLCQSMVTLVDGDCGTTRTMPVHIRDRAQLKGMDGKYFVGPNGETQTIRGNRTDLIGQKLQVYAVRFCETTQRGAVCAKCFGDLSWSVPVGTNIGHVAATEICRMITQRVLSNKHLDQSSMIEQIVLDAYESRFMQVMGGGSKLGLANELATTPVTITFSRECTPYLADIKAVDEIPDHALARYSQINKVTFNVLRKGGVMESATVNVAVSSRIGYFTGPFLKHIKNVGWGLTQDGNYEITLDGWDVKRPIFALPMKQMNMMDFKQEVEAMVKRSKVYPAGKNSPDLSDPQVVSDEVCAMFDLLNKRISSNFAHVEIILQATMIVSEENRDYRIPLASERAEFGRFTDIMKFRDLSAALAYEKQVDALNNPASYLVTERQYHPYSPYLRVD
jgi:hypothetical protein